MKLKTTGILTLLSVLGFGANANAGALFDIYAGGTAGLGQQTLFAPDDHINMNAQSYGAILGFDIPLLRVEAEYNYLNSGDANMHLGMLNGYFKIPSVVVIPYFGAGIGTIFNGRAFDTIDIRSVAAYQAMAGVTFDIPVLPIKIDGEARVLYAPDLYEIAGETPDLLHYDLRVKLRYIF